VASGTLDSKAVDRDRKSRDTPQDPDGSDILPRV